MLLGAKQGPLRMLLLGLLQGWFPVNRSHRPRVVWPVLVWDFLFLSRNAINETTAG